MLKLHTEYNITHRAHTVDVSYSFCGITHNIDPPILVDSAHPKFDFEKFMSDLGEAVDELQRKSWQYHSRKDSNATI